jgi:hypothetical protein
MKNAAGHFTYTSARQISFAWLLFLLALSLQGTMVSAYAARGLLVSETNEVTVGIEGKIERILNEPDYRTIPQKENDALILRIDSIEPTLEGQFKYTFAFMGLQSGVFNLADYLQTASGKRLREVIPAMSVSVRALLPEHVGTELAPMPQALPPRRIPYHPSLAALCLLWVGAGWLLYYKPRPKPTAPPPPPPEPEPPKSLGEILEPLAMKAARKTITTEEKVLLEQTVLRYWSEKLEIVDLDVDEQYEIIREDPEGGVLLGALERWLYQPASHILTSEVTKALQPYFDIPAPGSGPLPLKKNAGSEDDEDSEEEEDDEENEPEEDEEEQSPRARAKRKTAAVEKDEEEEEETPPSPRGRRGRASNSQSTKDKTDSEPQIESTPPPVGRRPGYRRRR